MKAKRGIDNEVTVSGDTSKGEIKNTKIMFIL
jgi:hypothetical protein